MKSRLPFRKPIIKAEEWETIQEQSEAAKELLNAPRFSFFRDYLDQAKSSVVDLFVRNKIRPMQEHLRISGVLTKTFTKWVKGQNVRGSRGRLPLTKGGRGKGTRPKLSISSDLY